MSAVKHSKAQQQRFFFQQQKTIDLTQQERKALSLVWAEEDTELTKSNRQDTDTAHCAVLGYN